MAGGNKQIRPEDGKQFSSEYQPPEKWTEKVALALGEELLEWLFEKDEEGNDKGNIFFNDFILIEKRIPHKTLNYLQKKFSSFSTLMENAKKIQETKLIKYGVGDRLNASMTKFTLNVNHGLVEREMREVKVEEVKPIYNINVE